MRHRLRPVRRTSRAGPVGVPHRPPAGARGRQVAPQSDEQGVECQSPSWSASVSSSHSCRTCRVAGRLRSPGLESTLVLYPVPARPSLAVGRFRPRAGEHARGSAGRAGHIPSGPGKEAIPVGFWGQSRQNHKHDAMIGSRNYPAGTCELLRHYSVPRRFILASFDRRRGHGVGKRRDRNLAYGCRTMVAPDSLPARTLGRRTPTGRWNGGTPSALRRHAHAHGGERRARAESTSTPSR